MYGLKGHFLKKCPLRIPEKHCEGKQSSKRMERNYKCPCCGYYTLEKRHFDLICPVCYWEDDFLSEGEDEYSVCNRMTLREARKNYREIGASHERLQGFVRKPKPEEFSEGETECLP